MAPDGSRCPQVVVLAGPDEQDGGLRPPAAVRVLDPLTQEMLGTKKVHSRHMGGRCIRVQVEAHSGRVSLFFES